MNFQDALPRDRPHPPDVVGHRGGQAVLRRPHQLPGQQDRWYVLPGLWVIWGQCCPRVAAGLCLPNGPITQLSPYLIRKPGIYVVLFSLTATPQWLTSLQKPFVETLVMFQPHCEMRQSLTRSLLLPSKSDFIRALFWEAVCKAKWWMAPPPSHFLVAGSPKV